MLYRATIVQSGASDPVATVHDPVPALLPTWNRHAEGVFRCDFGATIDPDKLFVLATPREFPDEPFWIKSARLVNTPASPQYLKAVEVRTAKVEDRADCDNVEFYVEMRIDA